ncbi:MAG: HalOD1 output domain-containing protein [Halosimplex sp.]
MEGSAMTLIERVVSAVTAETDEGPTSVPPLYESIDPEALETACELFDSGAITFEYADHEVTVRADRTVEATPVGGGHRRTGAAADD